MAKRKPKDEGFQEFNLDVPTSKGTPEGMGFPKSNLEDTQPKKPKRKPRPRWVNGCFFLIALGFCAYSASLNHPELAAPVSDTTLVPTVVVRQIATAEQAAAATTIPTNAPSVTPSATITETATLQPTLPPTATVMVVQPQLVIATNTVAVAFTAEPGLMMTVSPAQTFYAGTGGTNLRTCPKISCTALVKLDAAVPIQVDAYINGEAFEAGNAVWYRTAYNGQVVYAYSGVVQAQPPAAAPVAGGSGSTGQSVIPVQSQPQQQTWNCVEDVYNCGDLTCDQVQSYINACPSDPSDLDGNDNDGRLCESKCG